MQRRAIRVSGVVQGVGFRPFVYELARKLHLAGFVRNQGGQVEIEIEGDDTTLDDFLKKLVRLAPPLARIDQLSWRKQTALDVQEFCIEPSSMIGPGSVLVSPDVATCAACLAELEDPADRRYGYGLINCIHCGPRLTITLAVPYDRPRTTMAGFEMCPACLHDYENPADRRFHAQPICCPQCGPQLILLDAQGSPLDTSEPVANAVAALSRGMIVAIKGIGGYHLACNALNRKAVRELRRRKQRDAKPFALMVRDLLVARRICEVSANEELVLSSTARPIVLLRRRPGAVAEEVAPRRQHLGVMLPYSPLHHLLFNVLKDMPLVMTSGNQSDEPIAYGDQDAQRRLSGLADRFLTHNRPIHVRCDDSVVQIVAGSPLLLRRSRGYAPAPIALPLEFAKPTLALGGHLKVVFALGQERRAILSHHLGDLEHYEAHQAFVEAVAHYQRLFAIEPEWIVHDLHPDYATTRYALQRPSVKRMAVQHHHAHLASCLADNGVDEPAIGVIFDGSGLGTDGAIWGGEFLVGDHRHYRRAAHLRYVPMPGGEAAVHQPWRMAVSHLVDAGVNSEGFLGDVSHVEIGIARQLIVRRLNSPLTSSVGRLFDAIAALADVRNRVDYEGQAAMELECLAAESASESAYPFVVGAAAMGASRDSPLVIDTRPLIVAAAGDVQRRTPAAVISRRFHTTLMKMIAEVCEVLREQTGIGAIALSGGVFMNALLLEGVVSRLEAAGFRVYRHHQVPPNDGGLCLGQLAIAAAAQSCENPASPVAEVFDVPGYSWKSHEHLS
jgi:hydrogenase maturation protein HypF